MRVATFPDVVATEPRFTLEDPANEFPGRQITNSASGRISWSMEDVLVSSDHQFYVKLAGYLASCSPGELPQLMTSIIESDTWDNETVWSAVMLTWTHSNADEAMAFSREVTKHAVVDHEFDRLSLTISAWLRPMLVEIGTQFLKKDPDALLSLNEDWVPEVLESIFAKRTRNAIPPDLLLKHFDMLDDAGAFKDEKSLISMFHTLATDDVSTSRELLAKLSGDAEGAALAGLARGLAKSDPHLTSEILESFPVDDSRLPATQHLVASWTPRDPTAAADWVNTLAENEERAYAVQNLVDNWTRFDLASAESWLEGLPPSASRDQGTIALVDRLRFIDPESAFEWIKSIGDAKARSRAMTRLSEAWKHSNPARAKTAAMELRELGME